MATRSFTRQEDGRGWMGIRFQHELRAEPSMSPLPELRARIGAQLSDEEFLLRRFRDAGPGGKDPVA